MESLPLARAKAEAGAPAAASAAASAGPATATPTKGAHIVMVNLLYDPPVVDCPLRPYVLLCDAEGKRHAVDSDKDVSFRWYRGRQRRCSRLNCSRAANFQCLPFLDALQSEDYSFVCSVECLREAWPAYRELVSKSAGRGPYSWTWQRRLDGLAHADDDAASRVRRRPPPVSRTDDDRHQRFPPALGNDWTLASTEMTFTPQADDVGCALRLEVTPRTPEGEAAAAAGAVAGGAALRAPGKALTTSGCLGAPRPAPQRKMLYAEPAQGAAGSPFTVLCYNVLADVYATRQMYPYTAVWALSWPHRRSLIMQQLLGSGSDLLLLQEVQVDAFEDFFQPQLDAAGYTGMHLAKTRRAHGSDSRAIDGCALFFRRERFALVERVDISFDSLARQAPVNDRALRRMCRSNVALMAVLEDLGPPVVRHGRAVKRQLAAVCPHLYWDPEFADVKLWQAHALCRELERTVRPRGLPLVVGGDFNSTPDSAVYALMAGIAVRREDPVYDKDECRILPRQLGHQLQLQSAYAAVSGKEPEFTNYTGQFKGTLDYVWVSRGTLAVNGVLEIDKKSNVSKETAMPAPQYPSDHVCLLCELDYTD